MFHRSQELRSEAIVAITVIDLLASMAIWGTNVTVRLAG